VGGQGLDEVAGHLLGHIGRFPRRSRLRVPCERARHRPVNRAIDRDRMACWTLVGGDALAGVEDALVAESGETPLDLLVLLFESGGIEPASQCLLPKGQLRAVEWPGSVDHVIVLKVTAKSFVEALVGLIAPFPLQEVRKAALLVAGHRQLAERLLCPCPGGSRL